MKITDKMRLDWLIDNLQGSRMAGNPWIFSLRLAALDGWDGENSRSHRRVEIDAAIRASRPKARKGK